MIEIYYTGAAEALGAQKVPSDSLGGLVSGSKMPNDSFNNLFGEVSQLSRERLPRTIRVLAIRNTGAAALTGLKVYTEIDAVDSTVSFEVINSTY